MHPPVNRATVVSERIAVLQQNTRAGMLIVRDEAWVLLCLFPLATLSTIVKIQKAT